jgi:hypothetical protein
VSYPDRDLLDTLTVERQPLLHGPGLYDAAVRPGGPAAPAGGGVPGTTRDAQDVADLATEAERVAASGVAGATEADRRAAYQAYLTLLSNGPVQLAVKVAHEHLNKHSLVVAAGAGGEVFRLHGDHTLLDGPEAAWRAARAAAASRQAITDLLRDGETAVTSREIFDQFPDHVEQDGVLVSLPEWHRTGLRELCDELFARGSTRAVNGLMSLAFGKLAVPTDSVG